MDTDGEGGFTAELASFQLDDDGNPCRTAFGTGYDAWGLPGRDVLDNASALTRNEPDTALMMFYR